MCASLFSFLFLTEVFFPPPCNLAKVSLTLFCASSGEISTTFLGADFLFLLNLFGSTFFLIILVLFLLFSSELEVAFLGVSNFDKSIFSPADVNPLSLMDLNLIISSSFLTSGLASVEGVSFTLISFFTSFFLVKSTFPITLGDVFLTSFSFANSFCLASSAALALAIAFSSSNFALDSSISWFFIISSALSNSFSLANN